MRERHAREKKWRKERERIGGREKEREGEGSREWERKRLNVYGGEGKLYMRIEYLQISKSASIFLYKYT